MTKKANIIKNFIPSWFAQIMGTGILALIAFSYSSKFGFLKPISIFLHYFNVTIFFILLIPWILRWLLYYKNAVADLKNPVIGNFYPTISAGMLVISMDFLVISNNFLIGVYFWFIGVLVTIIFAFMIPYITFTHSGIEIHHINPGWFIPPVALIVIPIPGGIIIPHFSGILKDMIIFINYFSFGSGFFLFLALSAISLYRFILHHPLPDVLAPTIWINLGPIGAGTTAIINLTKTCCILGDKNPLFFFAAMFWGLGIFWVIMSIIMTLHYIRKLKFPYTMAWWALTFPLGAYTAATHNIAIIFNNKFIDYIGITLFILLIFFWLITFTKTLLRTLSGHLFMDK